LLSASAASWAVLGLTRTGGFAAAPVRSSIAALSLSAAVLFAVRAPSRRRGSATMDALCLPSLVLGGWAFTAAPPPQAWPMHAQALFILGALWIVAAYIALGRSFAILPGLRSVVARGPFRFIRHPAYAGHLALTATCFLAQPGLATLAPVLLAIPLLAIRIIAEEKVLMSSAVYARYAAEVRWRLVPRVW
jgi:protein-S-isoprenylcysteine O-methyltransferase Ste14